MSARDAAGCLLVLTFALLSGCATAPSRGLASGPTLPVWVAIHGHHTGLMVRARDVDFGEWPARADFPSANYLEVGWGDRDYYTSEHAGIADGLRALFLPTDSAVHAVAIFETPPRTFPSATFIRLDVSKEGFARMIEFVRATHQFDADGRPISLGVGRVPAASAFYGSLRTFHLFETCNTWIAHALREAGLPLRPSQAITAGALASQVSAVAEQQRRASDQQSLCHTCDVPVATLAARVGPQRPR